MDYKKFIDEYQKIQERYGDCENEFNENYQKLTQNIKQSLQGKTSQEYSQYFSELFDIWVVASALSYNIEPYTWGENELDEKYIIYKRQTSISAQDDSKIEILASRGEEPRLDVLDDELDDRKHRVKKLLDFSSISRMNNLYEKKEIIEYILNELWSHIFKKTMNFLTYKNDDNNKREYPDFSEYIQENWPLYELLNQISKIIDHIISENENKERQISTYNQDEKIDIALNTEELCQHILQTYILDSKYNDVVHSDWLPHAHVNKEIKLSHIIATSDLISYTFEYKLMAVKKKNNYLRKVQHSIEHIYNTFMKELVLYDAIESYIIKNDNEDIIITYNGKSVSPRTVLIFTISIIQETVRKSLTQSKNNIFHTINKNYRDPGLSKKSILDKINNDAKRYTLIFHYFEKPVLATIKKREEKLDTWLNELNKLRYGVLDDYLFDLAMLTPISFEEKVVTSIKTSKKDNFD